MAAADPATKYSLTFEHRPKYLYAYVAGQEDSYEISRSYWQAISDELKKTGYDMVLVDEDLVESATLPDVFQLLSELAGMGFAGIRIAFSDRRVEHKDLNDFGELVGTNRGLNGKAFNDEAEAEKWLLAGDD